jgi:hypothetical protein
MEAAESEEDERALKETYEGEETDTVVTVTSLALNGEDDPFFKTENEDDDGEDGEDDNNEDGDEGEGEEEGHHNHVGARVSSPLCVVGGVRVRWVRVRVVSCRVVCVVLMRRVICPPPR